MTSTTWRSFHLPDLTVTDADRRRPRRAGGGRNGKGSGKIAELEADADRLGSVA
jgi:hypothetical protein